MTMRCGGRSLLSFSLAAAALVYARPSSAQMAITASNDATTLANAILTDSNITITSATYTGAATAAGTFTSGPLGINDGIIITTGTATSALPPDIAIDTTTDNLLGGDARCDALSGNTSFDAASLRIEFTMANGTDGIGLEYVFGTEEYPDFVGQTFNDVVGIFLDGVNIGTDQADNPITINGPFFLSDEVITATESEYNGSTPLIRRASTAGGAGPTHVLEILICDDGDGGFDSGVFVAAITGCSGAGCTVNNSCGDGDFLGAQEGCDDGNNVEGDGCENDCTVTPGFACTNTEGAASVCADIDECTEQTDDCPENSTCSNLIGGFECACNQFFVEENEACVPDADEDTVPDTSDNCPLDSNLDQADGDFDLVGDVCDNCPGDDNGDQLDNDKDGEGNACDNCPDNSNSDQANADEDDFGDACDNCPSVTNAGQEDTDEDGTGDACELDTDLDGIDDNDDNCPEDPNGAQTDTDEDGVGDACDNCPELENADQADADEDGVGDACPNNDADGDGVIDDEDNCPEVANPEQEDSDGDTEGDACDPCPEGQYDPATNSCATVESEPGCNCQSNISDSGAKRGMLILAFFLLLVTRLTSPALRRKRQARK